MNTFLKKPLAVLLSLALTFPVLPAAQAAVEDALPEIGTTAGGTLSIGQENLMGDFYLRMIRSSSPMVYDLFYCNILIISASVWSQTLTRSKPRLIFS